jgi:oligoendopeptidase F
METGGLYDIGYSNTKMNTGSTTYLADHKVPYVFMNGGNATGVVHEFGHFCDGYVSRGHIPNVDTAEVYSQGMEYMSMFYADGTQNETEAYSLLRCYVLAAAQADFELRLYEMPAQEVTADSIVKLYAQVGTDWKLSFVGGFNKQGLVTTLHYYLSPMYMLSYAVSGDAALQLYELESGQAGAGLRCYEEFLASGQVQLLALLEEADLRSPFEPGAIEKAVIPSRK